MGYYSKGALALPKTTQTMMLLWEIPLPGILARMNTEERENCTYWLFDSMKMYPGYPQVDELNSFMDKLDTKPGEDLYGYIRVGEEHPDTEERGDPYSLDLTVNTSIEIYD